jgi:hypothetical protein
VARLPADWSLGNSPWAAVSRGRGPNWVFLDFPGVLSISPGNGEGFEGFH